MVLVQEDVKVREAKAELTIFYKSHVNEIFYLKQLQVKFEKKYFHWVTANAVNELITDGFLRFYT